MVSSTDLTDGHKAKSSPVGAYGELELAVLFFPDARWSGRVVLACGEVGQVGFRMLDGRVVAACGEFGARFFPLADGGNRIGRLGRLRVLS
ncbi:hypothetical protein DDD63_11890 [Actinobaculum sp. 313]|nr:hypothetical protein DDD63_11890 [Actinobaculum sp. 313]